VHRSPLDRHSSTYALQLVRNIVGKQVFPLHRLDKATSGVLLFALTKPMAAKMAALFRNRQVRKRYLAVVRGFIPENGVINHPLKEISDKKTDEASDKTLAHPAVTSYRRLATVEIDQAVDKYPTSRYSLVELLPATGRRHQLRRHMAHLSHPIIGDTVYGKGKHNRFFRENFGNQGLLLCAVELAFMHPETHDPLVITAEPDRLFQMLLDRFNWLR
jgi:tRNA pseudouridine65 synthase